MKERLLIRIILLIEGLPRFKASLPTLLARAAGLCAVGLGYYFLFYVG